MAIAPPYGLTISGSSSFQSARQASDWAANASLSSTTFRSPQPMPARSSAVFAASTGPMPKMSGSMPLDAARHDPRQRLAAGRPAPASSPMSSAPAPSLSG